MSPEMDETERKKMVNSTVDFISVLVCTVLRKVVQCTVFKLKTLMSFTGVYFKNCLSVDWLLQHIFITNKTVCIAV